MFGGRRQSSVKLTKNQPFSPVFIFFCFLLLSRTFGRHYSRHRLSHYSLHHNQTPNNLTWWLRHLSPALSLSLFSTKLLFLSTTATPAVAATTLSSGSHPYQQQ